MARRSLVPVVAVIPGPEAGQVGAAVRLKKESYQCGLVCGTIEAVNRYQLARQSAALAVAENKTGCERLLVKLWTFI